MAQLISKTDLCFPRDDSNNSNNINDNNNNNNNNNNQTRKYWVDVQ